MFSIFWLLLGSWTIFSTILSTVEDCFECFYYSQPRLLQEMRVWESSYTQTSTAVTFFFLSADFQRLDLVVPAGSGCFLRTQVGWGCTKPMLTLCKKFHKFFWYVTRLLNFKMHALTYEGWESSIFPKNPFALFPRRAVIDAVRFLSRWMWEKLVQDFPWISMSSLNLLHHIFAKTSVYWINWTQSLPDLRLRFRHVCARNSSLFPPNQYFFEGSFALCTIFLWTVQ